MRVFLRIERVNKKISYIQHGISNPCEIKKRFHGTGDEGKNKLVRMKRIKKIIKRSLIYRNVLLIMRLELLKFLSNYLKTLKKSLSNIHIFDSFRVGMKLKPE